MNHDAAALIGWHAQRAHTSARMESITRYVGPARSAGPRQHGRGAGSARGGAASLG